MSTTIHLPQLESTRRQAVGEDAAQGPLLKPEGRVLATLEEDGRRRWLRPKPSYGRWWRRRLAVAWVLIALYTVIPWTTWNGMPTVLLDLVERRFVFFGTVFRPTETLLFGLLFLSVFVAIFLLTALFGRVWCGWACPQTVYMEFVYRPIERFFLGGGRRTESVAAPWRRVAMYAVYLVISAHLANTLLAWFVGAERLSEWIFRSTPFQHPVAFSVFAAVTALMMFDFAFFREQLCSLVCPYGRFQSALLDRDSLVVAYDRTRGEPRGKGAAARRGRGGCSGKCGCDGNGGCGSKHACDGSGKAVAGVSAPAVPEAASRGDCIDCTMCVQTCPAGIDIRDGLQLECIHCTQCIDACDAVMDKVGKPRGLIRYSSERTIARAPRAGLRYRILVYPTLLAGLLVGTAYLIATRKDAAVAVLRIQGIPYAVQGEGAAATVESTVRVRIDNRAQQARVFTVSAGAGTELVREESIEVAANASREADVVVRSGRDGFAGGRREVELRVRDAQGGYDEPVRATVLGPLTLPKSGGAR